MARYPFLSLFLLTSAALISQVYGFCIYNNLTPGNQLFLDQVDGYGGLPTSSFTYDYLNAGDRACCSYHNTGCVAGGDPTHIIQMAVELSNSRGIVTFKAWVIDFPGGGWINVTGYPGNAIADAYDAVGNHLARYT